jgi:HEAT repeat
MNAERRLARIRQELETALDSEEEYLEEGAMGTYFPRSCAAQAAADLVDLFERDPPTAEELACCVKAISDLERIVKGKSRQLLLWLREQSHAILDALAHSSDPRIRIFALETAHTSLNPVNFDPLYWGLALKHRLFDDPDADVRVAAISGSRRGVVHNALFLQISLQKRTTNQFTDRFDLILARLNDDSAEVRAAAATVLRDWAERVGYEHLGQWASRVGHEALDILLAHESEAEARETLLKVKTSLEN